MNLKLLTIALIIISMNIKSYGQQISNIRFVHRGEELKPIGTLSISVDKVIAPNDRDLDNIYGKAIKTDFTSFKIVTTFVKKNKCLTKNPRKLHDNKEFYEVVIVMGTGTQKLYLGEKDIIPFFDDLKDLLMKNNADPNLISILKYY